MYLAGVEQVQLAIGAPNGESQVGDIQPLLLGHDGQDVTVLDGCEFLAGTVEESAGHIAHRATIDALLVGLDLLEGGGITLEHGVAVGVQAHVGAAQGLRLHKGIEGTAAVLGLALHFLHDALRLVALYPLAEVMVARGVAV